MAEAEELFLEIYNTLLQIRYPDITKAEPKNVEVTILSGENRICLLAWLLTEKSSHIANVLKKLKGAALEDELFKFYSEIGICTNKNILLGKCALKEQLPTLRLLLDFIRNVHMEHITTIRNKEESIDDILKAYINEDTNILSLCDIKPKMSQTEVFQYFEDMKSTLTDQGEVDDNTDLPEDMSNNLETPLPEEENKEHNGSDPDILFNTEKKNFLEAFEGINSWTAPNITRTKNYGHSMDEDIKNIYSDFAKLKEILEIQNELSKINVPPGLTPTHTPLNEIVEETVIFMEKFQNMYRDD